MTCRHTGGMRTPTDVSMDPAISESGDSTFAVSELTGDNLRPRLGGTKPTNLTLRMGSRRTVSL